MRVDTLPAPGQFGQAISLRSNAANVISSVEIDAGRSTNGGKSKRAKSLYDFFTACATAVSTFVDAVAPTLVGMTVAANDALTIKVQLSEGIDPKFVPAGAAFAVTVQVRTVTKVVVDGPFVYLTLNAPLVAGAVSVAYTQPGATTNLRDLSTNLLASYTATAVTNSLV